MSKDLTKILNNNIHLTYFSDKSAASFRVQNYYNGLLYYRKMLDLTMITIPMLIENMDYFNSDLILVSQEKINQLLNNLFQAQQNSDYVLLADIIELQWLPFLISLQEYIVGNERLTDQESFYRKNVSEFMRRDPITASRMDRNDVSSSKDGYLIEPTSCGMPTLAMFDKDHKYYLHSNGQIRKEAIKVAESWYSPGNYIYHIYGLGLGYPVIELAELDETITIHVYESDINIIQLAFTHTDFTKYLVTGQIYIHYDPEYLQISSVLENTKESEIFAIHYPSIRNIRNNIIKEKIEDYFINYSSIKNQIKYLNGNFHRNIKHNIAPVDSLSNTFQGKDLIIVASGPSLDKNYQYLKNRNLNTIILAVGSAAKKLLRSGIRPDYIIITDATPYSFGQFEGMEEETIPLLFLSTAYFRIIENYHGAKYIICQEGFSKAVDYARKKGYDLYQTGGSVSTAAIDIGIRFRCRKIITIGLDLAFTDNRDHASDTVASVNFDKTDMREIEDIYGSVVKTGKNLDIYRKWIENRIKGVTGIELINATEGGARIKGMINKKLFECLHYPS